MFTDLYLPWTTIPHTIPYGTLCKWQYRLPSEHLPETPLPPPRRARCPPPQACPGDQLDGGTTLVPRRTATDGDVVSYKIPTHADFLLCFSTVPGYYSWRNTTNGSWFVQALAHCLRTYGKQLDLLTVMTRVNRLVATDFQSNCPGTWLVEVVAWNRLVWWFGF